MRLLYLFPLYFQDESKEQKCKSYKIATYPLTKANLAILQIHTARKINKMRVTLVKLTIVDKEKTSVGIIYF